MTIAVHNVSFEYGSTPVLHDIGARAPGGKITAVVGPNAAGKSTLLKCIIGALRPRSGHASINGKVVRQFKPRELAASMAYVPQRSIVSAAFTVRQVVELGRYALPANPDAVEYAIERLDLRDVAERPYPHLSVGQQQRVTIARALAQMAASRDNLAGRALIMDEPTSALDLHHVAAAGRLFRELAARGAAVIVAMHDLSLAAAMADEVWLMEQGRMAASGAASDVLDGDRLQSVFHTKFQWVAMPDGRRRLLADLMEAGMKRDRTLE